MTDMTISKSRPQSHGEEYGCIYKIDAFSAKDEFDGADEGDAVVLTLVALKESEYNNISEFGGW